MYYYIHCF